MRSHWLIIFSIMVIPLMIIKVSLSEIKRFLFGFMVFNATFNIISAILWRSVLLVEETRGSRENHWPVTSNSQTLSHNVVSSTPWMGFKLTTLVVIGTDYTGSCKSNNHTITTTMAPVIRYKIIYTCAAFIAVVSFFFFLSNESFWRIQDGKVCRMTLSLLFLSTENLIPAN